MPLSPYISFAGNCAEASAFYQHAVGAELLYKITFGEMPKGDSSEEGCPSGMQFPDSAIAHSNVRIAGSDIMMSDGQPPGSKAQYAGFTLVLDTRGRGGRQTLVRQSGRGRPYRNGLAGDLLGARFR